MLTKTEAIVLKAIKYRETSKIVTLYTKKFGKLNVIAKGAMLTTSKFGASLEPMSYILAILYKKETRELQFLSQADVVKSFLELYKNYNKMTIGLAICEMVYRVIKFEEENPRIFKLLVDTLENLNNADKNEINLLWYFLIHLVDVLGFGLNFKNCLNCGEKFGMKNLSQKVVFYPVKGGFLCSKCVAGASENFYSVGTFKSLAWLSRAKIDSVTSLKIDRNINSEIQKLLFDHLREHVEESLNLKSLEIYNKLKQS
jgi:DNA repair protein RecO (recombination protein O)